MFNKENLISAAAAVGLFFVAKAVFPKEVENLENKVKTAGANAIENIKNALVTPNKEEE